MTPQERILVDRLRIIIENLGWRMVETKVEDNQIKVVLVKEIKKEGGE
ncbi:MAG: hypothetical protein J7J61_09140 [Candidatus Hydrothermae bacterium]|nr:hypothetical protein [Candidatus Hydrothermae bacterium]